MNQYVTGRDITKSDTVDLPAGPCSAIYCGSAGNIVIECDNAGLGATGVARTQLTFTGLIAGQILPVRAARVRSTNTTVTGMIALY